MTNLIRRHIDEEDADEIDYVEGTGAINFLTIDDITADQEGELINPNSIITLEHRKGKPVFPEYSSERDNPFLLKINRSGKKWIVFTDEDHNPSWVMDADGFLRAAIFELPETNPEDYCHEPIVVRDPTRKLGDILQLLEIQPESKDDDVIDKDIILLWNERKQIITGADILGRLLRGIANNS